MRQPNERGAVLVTAMLVLLVMGAIAVIAVRSTITEIASSGNWRLAKQGYAVAQTGSMVTLSAAANNAADFMLSTNSCKVGMGDIGAPAFDTNAWGSFGLDTWVVSGGKGPNFETMMVLEPGDMPAPGSSGSYCMKVYSWYTSGWMGGTLAETDTMKEMRMGKKRVLARVMVGPMDCGNGAGQWSTSQCAPTLEQ